MCIRDRPCTVFSFGWVVFLGRDKARYPISLLLFSFMTLTEADFILDLFHYLPVKGAIVLKSFPLIKEANLNKSFVGLCC